MFFRRKQVIIESLIAEYSQQVSFCIEEMCNTFKMCRGVYDRGMLTDRIKMVHSFEGKADDIRREIEVMMYSKALFPESRGDILGLLETLDKVPNQADVVIFMLKTHHIMIPEEFQDKIIKLAETCRACVEALLESVNKVFSDFLQATILIGKVDRLESDADRLETELMEQIFSCQHMTGTKKLLMRDLVAKLALISDKAENAGDRIRIIVAKRGF